MADFGSTLRRVRQQRKMTQQQLADELGIARASVTLWELNQTKPQMKRLSKIAKILSVSEELLLNGDAYFLDQSEHHAQLPAALTGDTVAIEFLEDTIVLVLRKAEIERNLSFQNGCSAKDIANSVIEVLQALQK